MKIQSRAKKNLNDPYPSWKLALVSFSLAPRSLSPHFSPETVSLNLYMLCQYFKDIFLNKHNVFCPKIWQIFVQFLQSHINYLARSKIKLPVGSYTKWECDIYQSTKNLNLFKEFNEMRLKSLGGGGGLPPTPLKSVFLANSYSSSKNMCLPNLFLIVLANKV